MVKMQNKSQDSLKLGFPGGSVVKNLPANAGDTGDMDSIPGSSLEEEMATNSSICRQRNLTDYSPWGCKGLDMTEHDTSMSENLKLTREERE